MSNTKEGLKAIATVDIAPEDDGLLDADTLDALIAMLDAATVAEDLQGLESLTVEQKQQLWVELSKETQQKIRDLKDQARSAFIATEPTSPDDEEYSPDWDEPQTSTPPFPGQVGDRAVLIAKPHFSRAELLAIFEVVRVLPGGQRVLLKAEGLSQRSYQSDWVLVYPKK